ncbi:unnamed protein product [Adineta steineri]|uniref:Uncharacterized protein n=1 Tax=Adineta steineri TaxID=433720 RepID=A0A819MWK0_9BILA|nr:unnamed protein product [Adineta steineri]
MNERSDDFLFYWVKDPNAFNPSEFLKKLKDAEGNEGTKEISQGAKYTITRDDDKCILAHNKGGSRMCRCNINVRLPPIFRLPPKYQDILNYD